MAVKMKEAQRAWGVNAEAMLKRVSVLACVLCLGCDLDGRDFIRQITEGEGDSGEDAHAYVATDPDPVVEASSETDVPGPDQSDDAGDPVAPATDVSAGSAGETDAGETAVDSDNTDTVSGAEPQCVCECVCDTDEAEEISETEPNTDVPLGSDADSAAAEGSDTAQEADTEPDESPAPQTDTGFEVQGACVIISEYVEGSGRNKGIELFNCGDAPIDLSAYAICLYSNDNTACGTTLTLSGIIQGGAVTTICHTSADAISLCDQGSGVANFSGDDRLALMRDGVVVDAFGELQVRPEGTPWADVTLRRCNLSPYRGEGPFEASVYFSIHDADDFSDFGLAPLSFSCDD